MTNSTGKFSLSESAMRGIDAWLTKYPPKQKRSAVVAALFYAQEENNGWLSEQVLTAVAEYLDLPPVAVYEVATFYDLFNLQPIGKHKISICTNISCMLRGSERIVACAEKQLGIRIGETTPDGMFTLQEVECMAACVGAPMCQIDDREYHENLTEEKMQALIQALQGKEQAHE